MKAQWKPAFDVLLSAIGWPPAMDVVHEVDTDLREYEYYNDYWVRLPDGNQYIADSWELTFYE